MSKKSLKLAEILLNINEIFDFDNIKTFPYINTGSNYKSGDIGLNVDFINIKNKLLDFLPDFLDPINAYNVSFSIDGIDDQAYKTDLKSYLPIMKTVVEIVKDFIQIKNPDLLIIISSDRSGEMKNDPKKDKIYKVLSDKYLPNNWVTLDVDNAYGMKHPGLVLYDAKLKKVKFKNFE